MKSIMKNAIDRLLTVKSIVTISLTIVFCILSVKGILPQEFMAIYTMIIGFYFGTQHEKKPTSVQPTDEEQEEQTKISGFGS